MRLEREEEDGLLLGGVSGLSRPGTCCSSGVKGDMDLSAWSSPRRPVLDLFSCTRTKESSVLSEFSELRDGGCKLVGGCCGCDKFGGCCWSSFCTVSFSLFDVIVSTKLDKE